jgi:hypothetical protein
MPEETRKQHQEVLTQFLKNNAAMTAISAAQVN